MDYWGAVGWGELTGFMDWLLQRQCSLLRVSLVAEVSWLQLKSPKGSPGLGVQNSLLTWLAVRVGWQWVWGTSLCPLHMT